MEFVYLCVWFANVMFPGFGISVLILSSKRSIALNKLVEDVDLDRSEVTTPGLCRLVFRK